MYFIRSAVNNVTSIGIIALIFFNEDKSTRINHKYNLYYIKCSNNMNTKFLNIRHGFKTQFLVGVGITRFSLTYWCPQIVMSARQLRFLSPEFPK